MSLAYLRPALRDVTFTEVDTGYRLMVDLHGLSVDELNLSVHGDLLAIEGTDQAQAGEERDDGVSPFSLRVWIRLPADADRRTISWRGAAGFLVITLDRLAYRRAA